MHDVTDDLGDAEIHDIVLVLGRGRYFGKYVRVAPSFIAQNGFEPCGRPGDKRTQRIETRWCCDRSKELASPSV